MYKTILKIDGMMCGMCEAHVNDTVRKTLPHAAKVKSSRRKGECTFLSEEKPDEEILRKALCDTGYKLISIRCEMYGP